METNVLIMMLFTLLLPFAFVVAVLTVRASERQRTLARIMEERRAMIDKGIEPPALVIPEDPDCRSDPYASLKASILMIAGATGLFFASQMLPEERAHVLTYTRPAAGLVLIMGLAFGVLHFVMQYYRAKDAETERGGQAD